MARPCAKTVKLKFPTACCRGKQKCVCLYVSIVRVLSALIGVALITYKYNYEILVTCNLMHNIVCNIPTATQKKHNKSSGYNCTECIRMRELCGKSLVACCLGANYNVSTCYIMRLCPCRNARTHAVYNGCARARGNARVCTSSRTDRISRPKPQPTR